MDAGNVCSHHSACAELLNYQPTIAHRPTSFECLKDPSLVQSTFKKVERWRAASVRNPVWSSCASGTVGASGLNASDYSSKSSSKVQTAKEPWCSTLRRSRISSLHRNLRLAFPPLRYVACSLWGADATRAHCEVQTRWVVPSWGLLLTAST